MTLAPADGTIYLDHAATTPTDPRVVEAILPYLTEQFGNPSSIYRLGQDARAALDRSRDAVARVLRCQPGELVFTGGSTESSNLALSGVAWQRRLSRPAEPAHVVTTEIEHHAVLHTAQWLERVGFAVTYVPCDGEGLVTTEAVEAAMRPETCLVSVIYANNETGTIQPVGEIAERVHAKSVPFHVDATQAPGLLPIAVDDLGVDLMSLAAHKFYGPKGVGLLYVRRGTPIAYQQHGGGQEGGRRGGTENVAGVVGMAVALDLAEGSRVGHVAFCRALRDRMWDAMAAAIPDVQINGPDDPEARLAGHLNVSIRGVQGETVLLSLDMQGVAASAGSACTTGNSEPSHVLLAMGLGEERARSSLRFSVGRATTAEQIDEAVEILAETVARVRELSVVR